MTTFFARSIRRAWTLLAHPVAPAPSPAAVDAEVHELVILDHRYCCEDPDGDGDMESCIAIAWSNGDLPTESGCTCGRYHNTGDMLYAEDGFAGHKWGEAEKLRRAAAGT